MADQQPPPGAPPPGAPPPGAPPPGAPPPGGQPSASYPSAQLPPYSSPRPLHRPGTVPLRPLTLADFFDASFRTIRANPKATIGMGALVTSAFLLLPILLTIVVGLAGGFGSLFNPEATASSEVGLGNVASGLNSLLIGVLGSVSGLVVAGMVVPVVTRAAIGRQLTIGESWRQAKGRLLALIGLSLLELLVVFVLFGTAIGVGIGLAAADQVGLGITVGVLLLIAAVVGVLAIHVRWFQLGAPALVSERRGVRDALARGGRLSRGAFWRVLGTFLLVQIVAGLIGAIVGIPFSVVGVLLGATLPDSMGSAAFLLSTQLQSIVSGALVAPFTATVAVLQYLDQRFRKEGFDIELIQFTGGSADQPR